MKKLLLLCSISVCAFAQSQIYGNRVFNGGYFDASGATATRPLKTGTAASIPSTCNAGDLYFETDATAGKNLYACTSANTWVQASGGIAAGVNEQTASYTIAPSDSGKLVVMNCSVACTLSMPTAPSNGFYTTVLTIGSSVPTISLSGKQFNGSASIPVPVSFLPWSFWSDGSNFFGKAPPVAGSNINFATSASAFTISATSSGGSGWTTGPLSGIPSTCAVGQAYFATDQPANQQLYTCSATNTWTKNLLLGSSGALQVTSGALDINTAVVPTLGNPDTFTALMTDQAGLSLLTTTTQPACSSSTRGLFWYVNNGASADAPDVCVFNGTAYAWLTLGSGGSGSFSALTGGTNTSAAMLVGTGASLAPTGTGTIKATSLVDSNSNPVVKTSTATTPVNQVTVSNAATGAAPLISATGTDANINLGLSGAGAGIVYTAAALGVGTATLGSGTALETGVDLGSIVFQDDNNGNSSFGFRLYYKPNNHAWILGNYLDSFELMDAGSSNIAVLDTRNTNNLYVGSAINATTGAGAVLSVMTSENGHIYTHGTAPTLGGSAGAALGVFAISTTGNVTSGNTSVTLTSGTGVVVGQNVGGSTIPNGTTVVTISGTALTLSQAPTGTNASETLTFATPNKSNDVNGMIAYAAGASGTLVFATPWASAPVCTMGTSFGTVVYTTSTTQISIVTTASGPATLQYHCEGTN